MDTKWKNLKIAGSFLCFFLGVTLLLANVFPLGQCWRSGSKAALGSADYQETAEFRGYIADRLEELLGVATGGKGWKFYGTSDRTAYRSYVAGDSVDYGWDASGEMLDRWLNEGTGTVVQEAVATEIPSERAEALEDSGEPSWWDEDYEDYYDYQNQPKTLKEYMADMAQNKNLRYGVVYKGKLLYTNLKGYEEKVGKEWDGNDFYKSLDPKEYNFSLWFNKNGDGKVEITKDGAREEIYGNGVYTADSRWFVPGYANFNVDKSTGEAVVFLAAAKEPRLYISGDYSAYGTNQYGSRLYDMQQRFETLGKEFKLRCGLVAAALLLLLTSFFLRRDKRRADRAIAGVLGKIWLELKILLLVLLPALVFILEGGAAFRESGYRFWYSLDPGNILYWLSQLFPRGVFLAACFWLVYLLVLDVRFNRGRQKKPLFDCIRTRDLKYPVQKRMVRRYYLALGVAAAAFATAPLLILLFSGGVYFWYEDVRIMASVMMFAAAVILAACAVAGFLAMRGNRRLAEDIGALTDQIGAVRAGNLSEPLAIHEDSDLARAAENLNQIQRGLEEALREQMQSERMKVELVTNVSHDIKTPLTAIISYVELLKQEEGLPVHVQEFVQILWEKSQRLKTIVQDVFEVSKAAAGQLPVKMEELDLGRLLRQVLADMDSQIGDSGLIMKTAVSEEPLLIRADGQRLYRVFQNLIQNALKYSLAGSRVYLAMTKEDGRAAVSIKNTSGTELDGSVDFAERFVRGDSSRTDGGSGLGLSIAKSFTEACGGTFGVETDADLFTVTVAFAAAK